MKRKIFSVLFALALGFVLAVLPASTVLAVGTPNPTFVTIDVSVAGMSIPADEITIRWEQIGANAQSGTDVIYITTNTVTTADLALVRVPTDFTLDGSTTASYWGYRISTENCTIRMPYETYWLLDTNSDSDVDTVLSNNYHPVGTAGVWLEWNMASASAKWCTVNLSTGETLTANIIGYYGSTVLGIALVAGSSTGAKVDAYLDNLVVNGATLLDEDTGTIEVLSGTIDGTPWTCSIQDGIDAALPGDTVNVAAGEYWELISLRDGVDVLGAGADVTTIHGTGSGSVVTADGVGSGTTLDGFTITNGNAEVGGGMYNNDSSPVVTNCTFYNNSAVYGGGMSNESSSPTVSDCDFLNNSAIEGNGGGMSNESSSPTVSNCTFSSNSAPYGGGMFNGSSSPTVSDCDFLNNSATTGNGGGMYNLNPSSPTLTNCTFSGNSAPYGGGMHNEDSSPTLTNCTFSGNSAATTAAGCSIWSPRRQ